MRGLGVGEQLQVSLDQMTTPSSTRPPSTMCPCSNDRFFTHVVYRDRSDSDVNASQSGSSLPSENTVITSVTNSIDSTPLHSLPGAGKGVESGRSPERGEEIQPNSHYLLHSTGRSQSYSLGSGPQALAQYTSVNSLSAAYRRPTYAFGSTIK